MLQTPSIKSASSAAISGLTPRHRALTAAPTWGGLSRCLARWPLTSPPRRSQARCKASMHPLPGCVTGNGRHHEKQSLRLCDDTVSVVLPETSRGCGGHGQWPILDRKHLDSLAETATSWLQIFHPAPSRAVAKMPRRPSLHISDRPARIGQSHLGRVGSPSPLSTKAASRSRGILETTIPQFASSCRTCGGCNGSPERINTSWPPPATHAVPRRTSFPHHLQPRLNWRYLATRANHHDTRI